MRPACPPPPTVQVDIEAVLRACEALETLHFHSCSFAAPSPAALRVDAPRSRRLRELAIMECSVERVDVVHLPGLENLTCDKWSSQACPVRFGPASAPSLKKRLPSSTWRCQGS